MSESSENSSEVNSYESWSKNEPPKKKRRGSHHNRTAKGGIPHVNPFIQMLQSVKVDTLLQDRKIVVLDDTNTVSEALKV
jgi:hypothetical protein